MDQGNAEVWCQSEVQSQSTFGEYQQLQSRVLLIQEQKDRVQREMMAAYDRMAEGYHRYKYR